MLWNIYKKKKWVAAILYIVAAVNILSFTGLSFFFSFLKSSQQEVFLEDFPVVKNLLIVLTLETPSSLLPESCTISRTERFPLLNNMFCFGLWLAARSTIHYHAITYAPPYDQWESRIHQLWYNAKSLILLPAICSYRRISCARTSPSSLCWTPERSRRGKGDDLGLYGLKIWDPKPGTCPAVSARLEQPDSHQSLEPEKTPRTLELEPVKVKMIQESYKTFRQTVKSPLFHSHCVFTVCDVWFKGKCG